MNKQLTRIISLLLLLVSMPMSAAVSKVITASFCEPVTYLFGCQTLTTSGTYHDTLTRVMPGDSIVELRLTIGHTDLTPLSATITEGESYLFGCKSLTGLTAAGSPYEYKDTLPNVTGCDSIIVLTLTVNAPVPPCAPSADTPEEATITVGDSYLFGCTVLKPVTLGDTIAYDSLTNYCGEDSVIVLTLHVQAAPTPCAPSADTPAEATITVGDSYLFGCTVLKPVMVGDTIAYDSLTNYCGEDSVIVLTLHVQAAPTPCAPSADTPEEATITVGDSYLFGCTVLKPVTVGDTIAYDSLTNYCGEDSVIVLTLHVQAAPTPCTPSADTPAEATITVGDSYLFGCTVLKPITVGDTIAYDSLTNYCGEDSVIVLTLHVQAAPTPCAPSADTPEEATITVGDSYLFGCTVLKPVTVGDTIAYDSLTNYCGEDSVIVLTLHVQAAPTPCAPSADTPAEATITVGDSYLFGCTVLKPVTVGDTIAYDSLTNYCGEDSVIVLTLTVNPAPTPCAPSADTPAEATITVGDSYLFGCTVLKPVTVGDTIAYDSLTNYCGEDSVIVLTLHVQAAPTPCAPSADTPEEATITVGDSYLFGCTVLKPVTVGDTIAYDSLTNYCGEDSVIVLTLHVQAAPTPCAPSADTPEEATITVGDSYLFGCTVLKPVMVGDTIAYDSLTNYCGEDSVIVLTLHVQAAPTPCAPSADTPEEATITVGDSYLFGCTVLTPVTVGDTIAYDSLTNYCGEDSVIVLTLHVQAAPTPCAPSADTPAEATITVGDSYLFGCTVLTPVTVGDTIAYDSLTNYCGEDSVIVLTLHVQAAPTPCAPSPDTNLKDTMILGDSYLFGCEIFTPTYGGDTILTDTLQNVCGADSVVVLNLHVIDVLPPTPCTPAITMLFDTITLGDNYLFGCQIITPADTGTYNYTDDLTKVGTIDCDSTVYLTLRVELGCTPDSTALSASITTTDSYLFGCRILSGLSVGSHIYRDTLTNQCGEDSVIKLTLTVYDAVPCLPSNYSYNDTVAMQTDYLFGCTVYNFPMVCDTILHDTLTNYCGSDSVVTLNLHVFGYVQIPQTDTVCVGSVVKGRTITTDSTFVDTIVAVVPNTPDTIEQWSVYVYDKPVVLTLHVVDSLSALPQVKKGCPIEVDGDVLKTFMNAHPATGKTDSVTAIEWYYKESPSAVYDPVDDTYKLSRTIDSVFVRYQLTAQCGTILLSADTVLYLSAYEYRQSADTTQATVCEADLASYSWRGHTYTAAGVYMDTVSKTASPCDYDSVYVLNLTVLTATDEAAEDSTVCAGDLPILWRGHTLSAEGIYHDTLQYQGSTCDSIRYTLNLTVQTATDATATDSIVCEADMPIIWRGQTLTNAGTYYDTLRYAATNCDSIRYTLNLTVQTATDATATDSTVCEADMPIMWRGQTLTTAGTYYDTLRYAATNCDSIRYTLNLTVLTATDATATDSIVCEADMPIMWRGQTLTTAGTYYDTLFYATGCDSIRYTLNLTVQTATDATATDSIVCEADMPILWRGQTLTTAGTYYDTIRYAATNCDSIRYTLNLTVQTATDATATDSTVCEADMPILWRGKTISAQGTYYDTLFYATGCDSIRYTLNLTVLTATDAAATDSTVCEADMPIMWRGQTLTTAGTYYDTLYYATGCDSIRYTLNLTVQTATDATATDSIVCEADMPILWRGQTLTTAGTYYDTLFYATGCDSIRYTLNLTVLTATDATATDSTVCEADMPIVWRGQTLTAAGTYYDTLFYATGCDSIRYTLNLTVQTVTIQSVEKDTICPDGYYVWRGDTLTEEGTYYDTVYYDATPYCAKEVYELDLTVHKVQQTDSLPAGAEYGMLLLINRVKLREDWNIDLTDDMTDKVLWYQVKGAVDVWDDLTTHHDLYNDPTDQDVYVGSGFYYTDGHNILDGEYYAILDWSLPTDVPCYHVWRTEILTPQTPEAAPIRLMPNRVQNGGVMLLTGIDRAAGTTTVKMVTASGQTIRTIELTNEAETELTAEGIPGVYLLRVDNDRQHETLKYIIVK